MSRINSSESLGVIEVTGGASLAKALQTIRTETRARLVGASSPDMRGVISVVIAGGVGEVQHALEELKSKLSVGEAVFFARPDEQATQVLLKSLQIADSISVQPNTAKQSNVRSIEDFALTDLTEWNVHELRRYARTLENFPLHGRQISKAKRAELTRLIEERMYETGSPRAYPANEMMPS
jgi:microcompartment protein CcmL/EutN